MSTRRIPEQHRRRIAREDARMPEAIRAVMSPSPPKLYKCAGSRCPGLPYRASDFAHPGTCVGPDGY